MEAVEIHLDRRYVEADVTSPRKASPYLQTELPEDVPPPSRS
jgi:hypothetical protein